MIFCHPITFSYILEIPLFFGILYSGRYFRKYIKEEKKFYTQTIILMSNKEK